MIKVGKADRGTVGLRFSSIFGVGWKKLFHKVLHKTAEIHHKHPSGL
jgi:hypothetical protein